jgi:hypothetical protein
MTMLRATWLTWQLHRFEVLVATILMLAVTISAGIVAMHLRNLTIPAGCWDWPGGAYGSEMCQRSVNAFFDILGNEGGHVRLGLVAVPSVVGLVLGTTLVGRELELRTASFAWSLEGGRLRWLRHRSAPMVLLVVLGLGAMAWTGSSFESAARVPGSTDRIGDLAMRGLPLLSRGLAALGIALLAGAVLGRTLPALLVASVSVGVLWYVGSGIVPRQVAPPFAIWVDDTQRREGDFVHVLDHGEFDTTRPGSDGEPGVRLGFGEWYERGLRIVCGTVPAPAEDATTYEDCTNAYDPSMVYGWWLAVPASAVPAIEGAEIVIDVFVAGGTTALTALVVTRRRPE